MGHKNAKIAFIACVILFVAALVLSTVFSTGETVEFSGTGGGYIVLSEILSSNSMYPAPSGAALDFIEVRNLSSKSVDISGYMLSDSSDSIGYTFPQGTVLPADGYAVVWCDKTCTTGEYASFGIAKDGSETIYLYNSANVLVDEADTVRMDTNVSRVRLEDGTWGSSDQPTPGYENSQAGYAAWLETMGAEEPAVVISEVMSGSSVLAMDASGRVCDWVELWNTGDSAVTLTGAYLSDDPEDPTKWQIPALVLEPGARKVIPCVGDGAGELDADFALSRDGCTVTLTGTFGNTISTVTVPQLGRDISWSLQSDGTYGTALEATPGYENSADGYRAWMSAVGAEEMQLAITEVMTGNRSTVLNAAGNLCDWIEIQNQGDSTVVLDGAYLSNDANYRGKWQIPSLTLEPGERTVILCSGNAAAEGEAAFNLSGDGCTVVLSGPAGNVLQQVAVPALEDDRSWALQEDGSYLSTELATPGYENTEEGRLAYNATRSPAGALAISEIMPSNDKYYQQGDGKFYDWVELVNVSSQTINLSDYCLSDDPDNREKSTLPDKTLEPGERVVVICCGTAELSGKYIYANFTLSREESWLYITGPDGSYSDYMRVYDVPYRGSVGRMEGDHAIYYFTNPTPGTENGAGVASISATPTALTADGIYNDVEQVVVELSGEGEIRYTTDGSEPTSKSKLYSGPIALTKTTVLRFASYETGKLASDVVTVSYIINEDHTLPVVSLALDPDDFEEMYDDYYADLEVKCSISLYEESGSFTMDGGLEMHGHMGLEMPKKSFKVNFRGRYGEDVLNYQVFGEDSPEIYDALCIRSGQDYPRAVFREQLFTSLCADATDNVLVQADKYCILYINGQYYGIYCLKEAFTELYYAQHAGVSEESVTIAQAPHDPDEEIAQVLSYCKKQDMSQEEHYQYVAERIDLDSVIDWIIMEAYCGNTDIKHNIRYIKSTENGNQYVMAFFDLDWSCYSETGFRILMNSKKTWQFLGLTLNLVDNEDFRQRLLERMSYHMNNTLTEETVLAKIQYYQNMLAPEMARERSRWGGSVAGWEECVQDVQDFLVNPNHWNNILNSLDSYINLTDEEWSAYFGR